MRARRAKPKPTIGVQCSRCRRCRYYRSWDEFELCGCGCVTGIIFMGRYEWKDSPESEARVQVYRAAVRRRMGEASRHGAGRKVKLVFRKKADVAKFKIVKRNPDVAKTAQAGSGRTGAKVEKVKEGKGRAASGRFIGRTTGLSVLKFQNKTLEENRKKRLSDMELVRLWKAEFPNAKSDYTPAIVRGVRSAFNRGKHGNNDGRPLNNPVPEFGEDRQPLPLEGPGSRRSIAMQNRQAPQRTAKAKGKTASAAPVKKLKKVAR